MIPEPGRVSSEGATKSPHPRTALIVGGGGLKGAYSVGVLRKLYDYCGADCFDTIYAVSVGVFASTFFAAGQVGTMESTWRNLVHGSQLVKFSRILTPGPILDLDYLIDLFRSEKSFLDLGRLYEAKPRIVYVLTNCETGRPEYFDAKNESVFDLMRASTAIPCLYSRRVEIAGTRYFDGGIGDPTPIERAAADGHGRFVVVLNRPRASAQATPPRQSWLVGHLCLRSKAARLSYYDITNKQRRAEEMMDRLAGQGEAAVRVFRPKTLAVGRLTRRRSLIVAAIEQGMEDAERVLASEGLFRQSGNAASSRHAVASPAVAEP